MILRRLHTVCDILLTVFAFYSANLLAQLIRSGNWRGFDQLTVSTSDFLIVAAIWALFTLNQNTHYAYRTKIYSDMFKPVLFLVLKGACGYLIWIYATKSPYPGRIFLALFLTLDFSFLLLLRLCVIKFLQMARAKGRNCQQIFVVGTGAEARKVIDDIVDNPKWGIRILGILDVFPVDRLWRYRDIPLAGSIKDLDELIKCNQVDYIVFAANRKYLDKVYNSIRLCEKMGVKCCLMTDFIETRMARKQIGEFLFRPAIFYSTVEEHNSSRYIKIAFDRLGALCSIIIALPLYLVISILIKLTSKGPVFFKQERCGLNGRRFKMLKFRTMVENAEQLKKELMSKNEMDGPVFKIAEDPRITKIGRILRKTSLDEIPQLFNIIKGDMSFVGPRPPLPDEVRQYNRWQRRKLSVKPGLTCLWQVGKRNDTTFEEWMKLDLKYIDNWSLWMDTKILLRTIPTVLNGTGK